MKTTNVFYDILKVFAEQSYMQHYMCAADDLLQEENYNGLESTVLIMRS